jgi:hypothetical protein
MTKRAAVVAAVIAAAVGLTVGGCVTGGTASYSITSSGDGKWSATVTSDKDTRAALIRFTAPDGKTTLIVQGLDSNGSTLGAQQAATISKQTDALVTIVQKFAPLIEALLTGSAGQAGPVIVPVTQPGR